MTNRFLLFSILSVLTFNVSAQVHKKFFNKNGRETKDSTKASSYVLYQKFGADSLWSVIKFDMQGIPILKGVYLDDELTIPYGKFTYYQRVIKLQKTGDDSQSTDTLVTVRRTGFYINGQREGMWIDYNVNGTEQYINTYERDTLNGPFEQHYADGKLFCEGSYIRNLREGDWYYHRDDSSSSVQVLVKFAHNIDYQRITYGDNDSYSRPHSNYNFSAYISNYLKKLGVGTKSGHAIVRFTVTVNGNLIKPEIKMGVDPMIDQAIIEAINESPLWYAARKNKKKIDEQVNLVLTWMYQ